MSWFFDNALSWLTARILDCLNLLWNLLAATAFTTPDITTLPQVTKVSGTSLTVVNTCFVLAILTAGVLVMTRETLQIRYGIGELGPRLVVAFIAANFSPLICSTLIETSNALTRALTGDNIASPGAFGQLIKTVTQAMSDPSAALLATILGLLIAGLTVALFITWIVRLGVLVVLAGIAPIALACHALPQTDPAARLWWRALLGTLATVLLQALALHTALSVFLDPSANYPALGIPHDPNGTANLFIVVCLLWAVGKIPALMRRYVTKGGSNQNFLGSLLRVLVVQQLTRGLTKALRGSARVAGAGRAVAGGRAARAGANAAPAGQPAPARAAWPTRGAGAPPARPTPPGGWRGAANRTRRTP